MKNTLNIVIIGALLALTMTFDYQYSIEIENDGCYTDTECESMPSNTPTEELDCDDNQCTPEQERRWENR